MSLHPTNLLAELPIRGILLVSTQNPLGTPVVGRSHECYGDDSLSKSRARRFVDLEMKEIKIALLIKKNSSVHPDIFSRCFRSLSVFSHQFPPG